MSSESDYVRKEVKYNCNLDARGEVLTGCRWH